MTITMNFQHILMNTQHTHNCLCSDETRGSLALFVFELLQKKPQTLLF